MYSPCHSRRPNPRYHGACQVDIRLCQHLSISRSRFLFTTPQLSQPPCRTPPLNPSGPRCHFLVFTNDLLPLLLHVAAHAPRRLLATNQLLLRGLALRLLHRCNPAILLQNCRYHHRYSPLDGLQHRLHHRAKVSSGKVAAARQTRHGQRILGLSDRIELRKYRQRTQAPPDLHELPNHLHGDFQSLRLEPRPRHEGAHPEQSLPSRQQNMEARSRHNRRS